MLFYLHFFNNEVNFHLSKNIEQNDNNSEAYYNVKRHFLYKILFHFLFVRQTRTCFYYKNELPVFELKFFRTTDKNIWRVPGITQIVLQQSLKNRQISS